MTKKTDRVDILFLTHQYQVIGGAEKALLEMVEYLNGRGLNLHVIVGDKNEFSDALDKINVNYSVMYIPFWAHGGEDPSPFRFTSLNPAVNTTRQMVELIQKINPKLCVTNTIVVPWLAYASALTNTRHAWMIHELGTAGLNLRYAIGEQETLRNIDLLSDIIFFNSQYTSSYYLPYISPRTRTGIVYPGGNTPKPDDIKSPYMPGAIKMILVGQIKPQKGQFDAVRAVREVRDAGMNVHLLLVGKVEDKKYASKMREFIKKHKIEKNVTFTGYMANPASFVKHADIAIVSSTNDAFGRVTVEAMMQEKPVIAAASAGTLEIIKHGKTGLLYKPGDEKDLADNIIELISNGRRRKSIAKRGKLFADDAYNYDSRYKDILNYFESLPEKTAINLTPLAGSFDDFTSTVAILNHVRWQLNQIVNSRAWRTIQMIRRVKK